MADDLCVGVRCPLGDLGLGLDVSAEELVGLGAAAGDVGGDRRALGQGEAIGALKCRDLAERELGQELGLLVVLAKLERGNVDLEAVEGGDDLGLEDVRDMSLAWTKVILQGVLCRNLHAARGSCPGMSRWCQKPY